MAEQIGQSHAGAPEGTGTMGFDEAFRFIGELAQRAAQGDESAALMLKILENQQLTEIRNLELELKVLNTKKRDAILIDIHASFR